jgi:hypothetical protein
MTVRSILLTCRYLNLIFCDGPAPTAPINVTAWMVQQHWVDTESRFESSNATLNAVWELSRYTQQVCCAN